MLSARNQRLKLVFAFMLGVTLTVMFFSAAWLESGWCAAGRPCRGSERPLRRVLSVFGGGGADPASRLSTVGTSPAATPFGATDGALSENSTDHVYRQGTRRTTTKRRSFPATARPLSSSKPRPIQFHKDRPTASNQAPVTSSFSIAKLKFGRRTHPVPSEAPDHNPSMTERVSGACTQTEICRERLSPAEDERFLKCTSKCLQKSFKFGSMGNGTCQFMDGKGRLPVALASFPGSGNTWARGLLEKVTGVCTGSLYCDCGLRVGGFTGEGVQGPSVIAMKTHNLKVQFVGGHFFSGTRVPYGAAILLVRDPRGALVAEWNRERSKRMISPNVSNHFTFVGEQDFGRNPAWHRYIRLKLPRWPQGMVNLLQEAKFSRRPVYVLIFEDLKRDPVTELKKLTDFLGFSLTEQEVSERLGVGFSKFYRNHTAEFSHFTRQQEVYVHHVVSTTLEFMMDHDIYDMFPRIEDYL